MLQYGKENPSSLKYYGVRHLWLGGPEAVFASCWSRQSRVSELGSERKAKTPLGYAHQESRAKRQNLISISISHGHGNFPSRIKQEQWRNPK